MTDGSLRAAGGDAVVRALAGAGVAFFRSRQRPTTERGDIDLVAASPAGVLVVDAKAWG